MSDMTNLRETIVPKSDRRNADDFLAGPETLTVEAVKRGDAESPVAVHLEGSTPWYPCKSMRRVLISAWGDNGADWVGKSLTLFTDPSVRFGGVAVGGIRISHLSDIASDLQLSLTATRGKRTPFTVRKLVITGKAPLPDLPPYDPDKFATNLPAWQAAIESGTATAAKIIAKLETVGTLTDDQKNQINQRKEAEQ